MTHLNITDQENFGMKKFCMVTSLQNLNTQNIIPPQNNFLFYKISINAMTLY